MHLRPQSSAPAAHLSALLFLACLGARPPHARRRGMTSHLHAECRSRRFPWSAAAKRTARDSTFLRMPIRAGDALYAAQRLAYRVRAEAGTHRTLGRRCCRSSRGVLRRSAIEPASQRATRSQGTRGCAILLAWPAVGAPSAGPRRAPSPVLPLCAP